MTKLETKKEFLSIIINPGEYIYVQDDFDQL